MYTDGLRVKGGLRKMKRTRYLLSFLILTLAACLLVAAVSVERKTVVGQSSTSSPDGNWTLQLRLVNLSTLLRSRQMLDAELIHKARPDWDVRTSIPWPNANPEMISNRDPHHPVVWSDDSSNVSYWINDQLKDTMRIEANEEIHLFERDLYALRAVWYTKASEEGSAVN